jgi:hypothetical protein
LYLQKKQDQLDEWKAELAKLKEIALTASPNSRVELNKVIRSIGNKIEECKKMLTVANRLKVKPSNSIEIGIETAWSALRVMVNDAIVKFKKE